MIRNAVPTDCAAIAEIYNYYVLNTVVTFEETAVTAEEMGHRMADIQSRYTWLVHEEEGKVIGYAYSGPWKARAAYRHASETSVYLAPAHTGKGIGRKLYEQLLVEIMPLNLHAIIGGIALPNEVSIRLHEQLGFKKIAHFHEVGWKLGRWVDVAYWQLTMGIEQEPLTINS
jgi:L-amino acid N-acyltransferase YncA